jgi:D-aminopeptidase
MSARSRDLGIVVGSLPTGRYNALTDVPGVRVGHVTIRDGQRIRTGVTAIVPGVDNPRLEPLPAAVRVFNGYGKPTGTVQVDELGTIETPILMTTTLNVWRVADALVDHMLALPGNEDVVSINPIVLETNDASLSDARARPVREGHVRAALRGASGGPVEEGSVGAGTAAIALGYKAGIGTSSRVVDEYTVGILVQANFGGQLRVLGSRVGSDIEQAHAVGGSCVFVVATDAPIDANMLGRLASRTFLGLGRCGADGATGSGDYCLAFSTARIPDRLEDSVVDRFLLATADAAEEAIYNSLLGAHQERTATRIVPAISPDVLARGHSHE